MCIYKQTYSIYIYCIYINANDERRNAINTRAKSIHRDIKRKLRAVDQKWNQSADTTLDHVRHI